MKAVSYMTVALAQDGSFGFAIQQEKGTYMAPTTWLPVTGAGESVQLQHNYVTLDMADSGAYETNYFSAGTWGQGRVIVPLVPGSLTSLLSWIQNRDGDGQGKWASVLIDCVHHVKKLRDAKVRTATFQFSKSAPVTCTLEIAGLSMSAGTTASPNMPVAAPYIYHEASVELATAGGEPADDVNCEAITIRIDTMLEECAEGMRLAADDEPRQLYNTAGCRVRGSFSRDFVDSAVYDDFAAGDEAALCISLSRGASSALLSLPRLLYLHDGLSLPGSNTQRLIETVQFAALASTDGKTAPIIMS